MFDSCATPGTVAPQAPLPTGFSRQEYWSGLPFPSSIFSCLDASFTCSLITVISESIWKAGSVSLSVFPFQIVFRCSRSFASLPKF